MLCGSLVSTCYLQYETDLCITWNGLYFFFPDSRISFSTRYQIHYRLISTLESRFKNIQIHWVWVDRSHIRKDTGEWGLSFPCLGKQYFRSCNWWVVHITFTLLSIVFVIFVFQLASFGVECVAQLY